MTTHTSHEIHAHSRSAFASLDRDKRKSLVLAAYLLAPAPMTDRECMRALGVEDPNIVRPRVTELIEDKLLWECDWTRCEITGRRVRCCWPTKAAREGRMA